MAHCLNFISSQIWFKSILRLFLNKRLKLHITSLFYIFYHVGVKLSKKFRKKRLNSIFGSKVKYSVGLNACQLFYRTRITSPLWKKLFRKIFAKLEIQVFNLAAAGCLKITQRPLNRNQRYYKTNLILFNNSLNLYFSVVFMIVSQIKKKFSRILTRNDLNLNHH